MSDYDEFDEIFRDLCRFLGPFDEGEIDEDVLADLPQLEEAGPIVDDELIIGDDAVTYLLFAVGRALEDFSVVAEERALQVKTRDFLVRKRLRFPVHPEEPLTAYRNGVLSVKMRRVL